MERLDKRAPFTATGGIIPPEFQNIKTPCYILDEKALTEPDTKGWIVPVE